MSSLRGANQRFLEQHKKCLPRKLPPLTNAEKQLIRETLRRPHQCVDLDETSGTPPNEHDDVIGSIEMWQKPILESTLINPKPATSHQDPAHSFLASIKETERLLLSPTNRTPSSHHTGLILY